MLALSPTLLTPSPSSGFNLQTLIVQKIEFRSESVRSGVLPAPPDSTNIDIIKTACKDSFITKVLIFHFNSGVIPQNSTLV